MTSLTTQWIDARLGEEELLAEKASSEPLLSYLSKVLENGSPREHPELDILFKLSKELGMKSAQEGKVPQDFFNELTELRNLIYEELASRISRITSYDEARRRLNWVVDQAYLNFLEGYTRFSP